jgi:hypothetical protein
VRVEAPRPFSPRLGARTAFRIAPLLRPNPVYRRLAAWLQGAPRSLRLVTAAERRGKQALFGCRMCGQCALPVTAYACPMTCPKGLRNGPCGGVAPDGGCEVHPTERCVWVVAHERAAATGRIDDLTRLQRPVDQRLRGSSSWVHYWLGHDEGLWTEPDPGPDPALHSHRVDLGIPRVGR